MKKLLAFILVLIFVLSLAACGEKSSESESKTEPVQDQTEAADTADETEAPAVDTLPFIGSGEVYFDINLSSGVFDDLAIKVGDQELTKSGKITFNGTDAPVVEGTGNGSDIFVVLYTNPTVVFNEAVVSTSDLQRALDIIFRSLTDDKTYILISDKADGFDHDLNPALTEYLAQHITDNTAE